MSINAKTRKIIKKFARLRGAKDPGLQEGILLKIYKEADKEMRAAYKSEAVEYIESVESGRLEAGEPLYKAKPL